MPHTVAYLTHVVRISYSAAYHIETSQLIFIADLLAGVYICCRILESIEIKGNIDMKSFHSDNN